MKIRKIISGGQAGADRAALDFALEFGIETGGFVPKNRLAEDRKISERYANLLETETENPAERTELNVINSDATLIFSHGELAAGSLLTKTFAEKHQKPHLHIDFSDLTDGEAVNKARRWLNSNSNGSSEGGWVLNIAGPRFSEDQEVYAKTKAFLKKFFGLQN